MAFAAFTEELDLWWVRGPINHMASGRVVAMRCEPGVGGRLLEVYEDDALELGRITVWEPGQRLAWDSSLMIFRLDGEPAAGAPVHVPWVYVDDISGHYERARGSGAAIVTELASPWGLPFYVAEDLEGNRWTFAQARPTMR